MVRIIFLIILILFVAWALRPFLRTKDRKKNKHTLDRLLNSDQSKFRQPNIFFIIVTGIILLFFIVWILPKFGINFFGLLQKIIPIISSLRGIFPF